MGERPIITEDDWVKPLVLVREIAERQGVTLTDTDEQNICRSVVEALTCALVDEVMQRREPGASEDDAEARDWTREAVWLAAHQRGKPDA